MCQATDTENRSNWVYTLGLEIRQVLCCQRVPNCFNDESTLDCALHRYPTHIRSLNYCHRMCICQGIVSEQSLKLFIHTDSTFHFCNSVNVGSSASMMDVVVYYCHTGRTCTYCRHAEILNCNTLDMYQHLNCNTVYMYPNLDLQDAVCILKCWMSTGHTYGKFIYTQSFNCNVVYMYPKLELWIWNVCKTWIYARYTRTEILNFKGLCMRLVYTKNLNCKTLLLYRILEW
jgi:hypothetical protein